MPLPNYGYFNKEEHKKQQLVFEAPPEIVSDDDFPAVGNRRRRAKVTTGKIDIDVERKLVFKDQTAKNRDIWKPPKIDQHELEQTRRYSSPGHQQMKSHVKSTLDSFISSDKVKDIKPHSPSPIASQVKYTN